MLVQIGDDRWVAAAEIILLWSSAEVPGESCVYLRGMDLTGRPIAVCWPVSRIVEQLNGRKP